MHARLARRLVALPAVTGGTRGDDVLPHRLPAAAARDHVVDREASRLAPAVLARPGVASEHRLTGDLAPVHVARDAHVADEPDHAGSLKREAFRVKRSLAALEDLRALLQHQHGGPSDVADVDRLIACVQDQDPAADAEVRSVAVQVTVAVRGCGTPVELRSALAPKPYVRVRRRVHSATIVDSGSVRPARASASESRQAPGMPLAAIG